MLVGRQKDCGVCVMQMLAQETEVDLKWCGQQFRGGTGRDRCQIPGARGEETVGRRQGGMVSEG